MTTPDDRPPLPTKFKPWQREKLIGKKAPHPVDERLGFVNKTYTPIKVGYDPRAIKGDFDALRKGIIEDGKRYLGNGAHQRINTFIP